MTKLKVKVQPPKLTLPSIDKNNKPEQKPEVAAPIITSTNNKQEIQPALVTTQNSDKKTNQINKQEENPVVAAPITSTPLKNKQEKQPEAATSCNNINDILKPPMKNNNPAAKKQTTKKQNKEQKLREAAKNCTNITKYFKPRELTKNTGIDISLPRQSGPRNVSSKESEPQLVPELNIKHFILQRSDLSESVKNLQNSHNLASDYQGLSGQNTE